MIRYTEPEIQSIIENIIEDSEVKITPIGNHHLKRHLVYKVDSNRLGTFTFKLYYRDRRRSREVASLTVLKGSEVKCPRIIHKGVLESGHEWLMLEFREGVQFDSILEAASGELTGIFEQIGEELAKMHVWKEFEFFGEWDESGESIKNIKDYYSHFVGGINSCAADIENQDLPDKALLYMALEKLRSNYELFRFQLRPRMTHHDFDGRNIIVYQEKSGWCLQAIIDFEGCCPGNTEMDLVQLYKRYFIDNKEYEEAFMKGYNKYFRVDEGFYERLPIYLLAFAVSNCSWAYAQAPDYYFENIELIKQRL